VDFKGRNINIQAFLEAFPYDSWRWDGSLESRVLYIMVNAGESKVIHKIELPGDDAPAVSLSSCEPINNMNFANRLSFNWHVRDSDGSLFLTADKQNNERFNLLSVSSRGEVAELTEVAYTADYRLSPDGRKVAYTERQGNEGAPYHLHVKDLTTGDERVIATDTPEAQMTWGSPSWQPGGEGLIVTMMQGADRNRGNIAYAPLDGNESSHPAFLLPTGIQRTFPEATTCWLDDRRVLVLSDEKGAVNLFVLDIASKEMRPLTDSSSDVGNVHLLSPSRLVFTVSSPVGTKLYSMDPTEGKPSAHLILYDRMKMDVLDVDENSLLVKVSSATVPGRVDRIFLDGTSFRRQVLVALDDQVIEKIVHSDVETVLFDTFDDVPMSLGGTKHLGKLHGFLYRPKHPLPESESLVAVESFYGGTNNYSAQVQILCAAGIYVFSPSPRGVADISGEFEKLNDRDLGGREVIDVMYGGRHVSKMLGIAPARMGVFGHSHGGYETMRHMTFTGLPGVEAELFTWGWGVSQAGFSSIKEEYEFSNIQNWIRKEAGDPDEAGVAQLWEERSPINHIDDLKGRLLMIHGTSDRRVPYSSSKRFFDSARMSGKEHLVFLESLEGTGHSFSTIPEQRQAYTAWFRFLENVD